jgi:quinolinate synthase
MNAKILPFSQEIDDATKGVYEKLEDFVPVAEWSLMAPLIYKINQLKKQKNAVVLAHNYMTPDIFHGISDIVGDSLALAREAVNTDADIIIVCGVHFMAETVKILNPSKTVLIADMDAGCSLAESITPRQVRELQTKHPGVPVLTYVNTSADVKAECDICVTSGNALEVVNSFKEDTLIFLPDQYLAAWVASQTDKKIITWEGACEVHEKFTPEEIHDFRQATPGLTVIAHPECPPDVIAAADFAGSTAQMINFVRDHQPKDILMVTECSMSDNLAGNFPDVHFIRPCNLCPHMKKITLPKVLESLENLSPEVLVSEDVIEPARRAIQRMLDIKSR